MPFDIDDFVKECRTARVRPDWPEAIADIVKSAITDPDAISEAVAAHRAGGKGLIDVFERSEDLTILNIDAEAGALSPPHDHATIAIVGVYQGSEGYRTYRADGSHAVETGRLRITAPDVTILSADTVHALDNTETAGSAAIHIYGNSFFDEPDRRLWNPYTMEELPFDATQHLAWTDELSAAARAGRRAP